MLHSFVTFMGQKRNIKRGLGKDFVHRGCNALCARLPTTLFSMVSNTPSHANSMNRGGTPDAGKKAMLGLQIHASRDTRAAAAEGTPARDRRCGGRGRQHVVPLHQLLAAAC